MMLLAGLQTAPDGSNAKMVGLVGGHCGKIVMLTESQEGPYDRPNCSKDYLQGKAPDEWMPLRSEEFYQDYGIEIRTGQHVTALDSVEKRIELASGETLTYDKALVCSGGKPNSLPGLETDLKGVYVLRSLHDSQTLPQLGATGQARGDYRQFVYWSGRGDEFTEAR